MVGETQSDEESDSSDDDNDGKCEDPFITVIRLWKPAEYPCQ